MTSTKIENKISLRCVQNADIELRDVFVPDEDRLSLCNSFEDTNKVLGASRIMVAWAPVGLAMGAYDLALRYLSQRRQFGSTLDSFQLSQEKLGRMLGNIQGMAMQAWRLTRLFEEGRASHALISMTKAWNTLRGRECAALARELLGGNGILSEFTGKAFCDAEALYTYEGTYDINSLVIGREVTGKSAIKAPRK